jgi:hypothetical protein
LLNPRIEALGKEAANASNKCGVIRGGKHKSGASPAFEIFQLNSNTRIFLSKGARAETMPGVSVVEQPPKLRFNLPNEHENVASLADARAMSC